MRPIAIPACIQESNQSNTALSLQMESITAGFQRLLKGWPEVSVVIPAYYEEAAILKTLYYPAFSRNNCGQQ